MATESSNSGFDELMRLSQQLKQDAHEITQREEQNAKQREKAQDVLDELRTFSISMAVRQLQPIATPQVFEQVKALKSEQGTAELRKSIHELVYDLEKRISIIAVANSDIKPIECSIKTLSILLELLFSLE